MILVTGGTGLVGSHLLYFLLKDNQNVRAIHRKSSNLNEVKKVFSYYLDNPESLFNKIEWIEADITNIPALTEAFKGITLVYHAAAYISFDTKHYYKLKKTNIEGTANIVNLCLTNNIVKLCYVSSIATISKSIDYSLITEENQWNPEDENSVYAITKYGAELEVWRGTQEGLTAVIVNPGVIMGSGHWHSGSGIILNSIAKGIPFYTLGGIGIVDVQDVTQAMIELMKSTIKNERFILVSKSIYYRELLTNLAISLHKKPPKFVAKKWLLMLFSKIDWVISKLFGTKRKMLKATVNSLFKISFYDASKIEKELNFKYTPYQETLKRVASNYLRDF